MQKRRTLLTTIGTAGTVAIAGCSGSSDNQEEEQDEEQEEREAEFEIVDFKPSNNVTINPGDSVEVGGTIENVGNATGEFEAILSVGEYENRKNEQLEPSETYEIYDTITEDELSGYNNEVSLVLASAITDSSTSEINLVYSKGDTVNVENQDVSVTVTESYDFTDSLISEDPNGTYYFVKSEVENSGGDESIDVGNSFFILVDNQGRTYESDSDVNYQLEDGIEGLWETLNPGTSATIAVLFDIPEDLDEIYLQLGGEEGFFGSSTEYRIEV